MSLRRPFMLFAAPAAFPAMGIAACSKPPDASATGPAGSIASREFADIALTENVKTALFRTASLKDFDIAVVTLNGDERLNGVLDSQAQIDETIRVARAADGAHTIHDELTITK